MLVTMVMMPSRVMMMVMRVVMVVTTTVAATATSITTPIHTTVVMGTCRLVTTLMSRVMVSIVRP